MEIIAEILKFDNFWHYVMAFLALNMAAANTMFAYGVYLDWKKPKSRS